MLTKETRRLQRRKSVQAELWIKDTNSESAVFTSAIEPDMEMMPVSDQNIETSVDPEETRSPPEVTKMIGQSPD